MSPRLLPRPTAADRGVVALVTLLVGVVVAGTAVAGTWLHATADEMAAEVFRGADQPARQVSVLYAEAADAEIPDGAAAELEAALAPDLAALVGQPRHAVSTPETVVEVLAQDPGYSPSYVAVVGLPDARDLVEVVEGRFPRPGTTQETLPARIAASYDGPRRVPVIEVVVERRAAEEMDVRVGSYLDLVPRRYSPTAPDRLTVPRVSGLYEATAPYPSPLDDIDNARHPAISTLPEFTLVRAAALAADERTVLQAPWATEPEVRWTFDPRGVPTAEQAAAVVDDARLLSVQPWPAVHDSGASTAVTGIGDLAERFLAQRAASDTLAALVLSSLAAAALALLLAAAAVLEARRREVADVLRARGAGTGRLALLRGGEALLVAVPGLVVVGVLLLLGEVGPGDALVAAGAAVVCAVLLVVAQVSPWHRLPERVRLPARDALQIVTVLLAVGVGAVLLTRERLPATDPLLLLMPALVGAAGAVLVVRALRLGTAVVRRAAGGPRLTPLVGAGQVEATARHVTLPVAAVVLGVGAVLVALAVHDTLHRGADDAGWSALGADVLVSDGRFEAAQVDQVRQVPGVREVAPVYAVDGLLHTLTGREAVQVLGVDPDTLAEVTAASGREVRVPAGSGEEEVGALVTAALDLEDQESLLEYAQADVPLSVVGRPDRVPGVTGEQPFVLMDVKALRAASGRSLLRATTLLVSGDPDPAAVRAVVERAWPTARVATRDDVSGTLLEAPVARRTLAVAGAAAVGSALVVLFAATLAVALGAPLRRRTRAVLRALGADARQVRRVGAVELVPSMLVAALVAAAGALVLMAAVGKGARLAALTGAEGGVDLALDGTSWLLVGAVVLAGAGLLAVASARGAGTSTTDEGGTS